MKFSTDFSQRGALATIRAKLGEVQNVVFLAAANEIQTGAMLIQRHATISIYNHESVSKTVHLSSPKRDHDVSEPGSPPNSDLGKLAQSVAFEVDPVKLEATIGTNLLYGKFLELGTVKMKARPWLFPAFESHKEEVKANFAEAVKAAIKGGAA